MINGPGWSFSLDEQPKPVKKENPDSNKPKISLEKRVGKYVTTIAGLHTYGADRLSSIAKELKSLCWAGDPVKNGAIEI